MSEQQKQRLIDLPKVIAGAIASPLAALLTSRFGVAGTMVGLALSAVVVTVISDVLKVYLQRAPGAVTRIEGGFRKQSLWRRVFHRLRHPFSKFFSLTSARRRSILTRSVIAGVIMFLVGLVVVTGLELSVGKDFSCWVWKECPTETSADGSSNSNTATLPSILGGGQSTDRNPLQIIAPLPVQQQPTPSTGNQGAFSQPSPSASGEPSTSLSSRKQSPSSSGYQQQGGYEQTIESQQQGEYQQQTETDQTTEYLQQQGEYQQQNSLSNLGSQQQNPSKNSSSAQQNPSQQKSLTPESST